MSEEKTRLVTDTEHNAKDVSGNDNIVDGVCDKCDLNIDIDKHSDKEIPNVNTIDIRSDIENDQNELIPNSCDSESVDDKINNACTDSDVKNSNDLVDEGNSCEFNDSNDVGDSNVVDESKISPCENSDDDGKEVGLFINNIIGGYI